MSSAFPLDTVNSPSRILELLYQVKVRDVMSGQVKTAGRETPLREIQGTMKANGITGVPIVEGPRLIGLVSMDDIIRALEEGRIDEPAEAGMTRNLIVLEDDMPLSFAISYMDKYHFGRFPVISKDRRLVGIITSRDIIVHLLLSMNRELEQLEQLERPVGTSAGNSPLALQWQTRKFDFEQAGKASTEIKKTIKERLPNTPAKLLRRIAIASYELEMNQVVHSEGGTISFTIDDSRATILAEDRGPGIDDLESALTEGGRRPTNGCAAWASAPAWGCPIPAGSPTTSA
jgi:CBS domain-containing protein